jgi:hypothetical protein
MGIEPTRSLFPDPSPVLKTGPGTSHGRAPRCGRTRTCDEHTKSDATVLPVILSVSFSEWMQTQRSERTLEERQRHFQRWCDVFGDLPRNGIAASHLEPTLARVVAARSLAGSWYDLCRRSESSPKGLPILESDHHVSRSRRASLAKIPTLQRAGAGRPGAGGRWWSRLAGSKRSDSA